MKCSQYKGKEYTYHEPIQTPIAPPYAEALSLLEHRRGDAFVLDHDADVSEADVSATISRLSRSYSAQGAFDHDADFNEADVSAAIENESASSLAQCKEFALMAALEDSDNETNAVAKTIQDKNKEENTGVDALQNLYISEEDKEIDNT